MLSNTMPAIAMSKLFTCHVLSFVADEESWHIFSAVTFSAQDGKSFWCPCHSSAKSNVDACVIWSHCSAFACFMICSGLARTR